MKLRKTVSLKLSWIMSSLGVLGVLKRMRYCIIRKLKKRL